MNTLAIVISATISVRDNGMSPVLAQRKELAPPTFASKINGYLAEVPPSARSPSIREERIRRSGWEKRLQCALTHMRRTKQRKQPNYIRPLFPFSLSLQERIVMMSRISTGSMATRHPLPTQCPSTRGTKLSVNLGASMLWGVLWWRWSPRTGRLVWVRPTTSSSLSFILKHNYNTCYLGVSIGGAPACYIVEHHLSRFVEGQVG